MNGEAHGFFNSQRGLKQGDPLSPYLFIIAFDYLSKMLDDSQKRNSTVCFKDKNKINISHLMFVDDVLLFCNARKTSTQTTIEILKLFEKTSGMSFNKSKYLFVLGKHYRPSKVG